MGRYAVLVCGALAADPGPAGAGKSTFCASLITHAQSIGRNIHLFNLDPAAEHFEYEPTIDIRELISLEDVMEEIDLGPNGGLVYCFECVVAYSFARHTASHATKPCFAQFQLGNFYVRGYLRGNFPFQK